MSRILFVVQQSTDRVLPFPPPADSVRRTWLMKKLRLFQRLDTPFILTDGGKEFYKDWYNEIGKVKLACEDQRLAGYFERKPDHLIRLAMVLSVARGEALELTAGLFQEAIAILDTLEVPMPDAFTSFGEAVFGANARRVVNHLSSTVDGKMEHSTLLQKNIRYMDKRSFQTCIDTLIEAKMIDTTVLNRKRYYILLSPKED